MSNRSRWKCAAPMPAMPVPMIASDRMGPPGSGAANCTAPGHEGQLPAAGGRTTVSITWITPFDAATSAAVTCAPFTYTFVGRLWIRRSDSDSTVTRFDLFDAVGRWLDVLELRAADWPRDLWVPVAIRENAAAVLLEGDDARPLVRVYRIVRRDR